MYYQAKISREGKYWLAEFPDCPGCQTFAESEKELQKLSKEALEGWLEAYLLKGEVPSRPNHFDIWFIRINSFLAFRIKFRWFLNKIIFWK